MSKQLFIKRFRTYMLLIALASGFLFFLAFHYLSFMAPLKPAAFLLAQDGLPAMIFIMLFCSFCKVKLHDMRPRLWHFLLLIIQLSVAAGFALYIAFHPGSSHTISFEGIIVCFITPTAAAAAVITGKLGGNESVLTTYTLMSNLGAAIGIPLIFPLFTNSIDGSFLEQFATLSLKIFPVIILPLLLAFIVRACFKKVHAFIVTTLKDLGFYLWGFTLMVVSARTFANIANSSESTLYLWALAGVGLACAAVQFSLGKLIGQQQHQRISAGQALGQKNMVFGLWIALTYLSPAAAIAPGTYILWQNFINAWQMWYREHKLTLWQAQGIVPYQE